MKIENADLRRSDILGEKGISPEQEIEAAVQRLRRRKLGYFSMFAGAASILGAQAQDVRAEDAKTKAIPPRVAERAAKFIKTINENCTKPELLQRQSGYLLPHQKGDYNIVDELAGGDSCPGNPIPGGVYTAANPFVDSGDTTGANGTVDRVQSGCFEQVQTAGPDHIYSFTLTARGAAPQIRLTTVPGTYDPSIYILNGATGTMCPAGLDNVVTNCLAGADPGGQGAPETITAAEINALPLNVPLYLFVDSFYGGTGSAGGTGSGPYTIRIQDVTIAGGPALPENDAPVDMNGDGRTDYTVIRNTGGQSSQATWFTLLSNQGNPVAPMDWGVASDQFVPADYDGDGKDDIAVFRSGDQSAFYIVQSQTMTMRIEEFGQTGDDATVVADYNGDNKDDIAVYRSGATTGAQSFWFYKVQGAAFFVQVPWGINGDFPAPGDYDGDNRSDFVVQRADGSDGVFFKLLSSGSQSAERFGTSTDVIVPGDYDDDGKTDIAVVRAGANGSPNEGFFVWDFEPSGTAGTTVVRDVWGESDSDFLTQGDYDGDGKTDYGIWRPGVGATLSTFWYMTVGTRNIVTRTWGEPADYPVANYNVH